MVPRWVRWARELHAIAQTGLRYAQDPRFAGDAFDVERYERVRRIAAEILTTGVDEDHEALEDVLRGDVGDATPKVDVRGAVFEGDDHVLLVRERADDRWTLPGGWAEVNEPPSSAVTREVEEESGYRVHVVRLLALWDRDRHDHPPHAFHIWKAFFECAIVGGGPEPTLEASESRFWRVDALPELSTGRVTRQQLLRLRELHRDRAAPTVFD